ncbi:MAG TPA: NAD-dependent epimerase/dehydratase family protein [Pseudogracilibacillus sp.]|nr:NAD-dependent epimerase/dehydratase family protein [Pseudogracilibacillus sp.]
MKRVLITGVNSYVGNSFAEWIEQYPQEVQVDKVSLRDDAWKELGFSKYDSILHVAGIAHVSRDPKMEELYYKVNRDLTIEVAEQAKAAGVKQFIFMSSIIVYGDSKAEKVVIDESTEPKPTNFYGQSKLDAEAGVRNLEDNTFNVAIIRPPMIYGNDSKGNYPKLAKAAQILPVFPDIRNVRSMLHIDNLSEFLRLMIKNEEAGLFFPQNQKYVRTSDMVKMIAEVHGRNLKRTKLFNGILNPLISKVNIINKVFGNLVYDKKLSYYKEDYQINNLYESIIATELE